jgi:transaldolase
VKLLEEQGLASFDKSWDELIASVTSQLKKAGAEVTPVGATQPVSSNGLTKKETPASAAPRQTAHSSA